MKLLTLAVVAASIVSLALPSIAEAAMTRHSSSHSMMKRSHHMHRGRTSGRMAGHRTF